MLVRSAFTLVRSGVESDMALFLVSYAGNEWSDIAARTNVDGSIGELSGARAALLRSQSDGESPRRARVELVDGRERLAMWTFATPAYRVCVGLARPLETGPFAEAELRRLEYRIPIAWHLTELHMQCVEHQRRELVQRSLRNVSDASCVVDVDQRSVRWIYDPHPDQSCAQDVLGHERKVIDFADQVCADRDGDDGAQRVLTIGRTAVVRVADLGRLELFRGARSLALALARSTQDARALSVREKQIAQLLATGYSTVNAAAILSLSENTIRTYVRRLYRKLEITNRADLTRKCAALGLH